MPTRLTDAENRADDSDAKRFAEQLAKHRARLRRIVELRLHPRLSGRIDPSDVIQETYLEASKRYTEYRDIADVPVFLWLRFLTLQQLALCHRKHLGTKARDARRDVTLFADTSSEAPSAVMARQLIGSVTDPCDAAMRAERLAKLQSALEQMEPADVKILVLRHFEELTYTEISDLLDITRGGASHRYQRALKRLRLVFDNIPGGMEDVS